MLGPKSILYVLPAQLPVAYEAVGATQRIALDKKLPFAVVYQLRERSDDLERQLELLRESERHLAKFHIPLILLLGPSEPILKSLIHHSGAEVLSGLDASESLSFHPHRWPGTVRTIDELQPIIDQMTTSETRTFC